MFTSYLDIFFITEEKWDELKSFNNETLHKVLVIFTIITSSKFHRVTINKIL